jgi:UDP-N-acetylglucosamine diphosphorylase/glucosamine-1-phosphate N-acetyltransferase
MQAIILAAGECSRFWPLNQTHKSLFKIMGKPLIWHTVESLRRCGLKEIIIVQGPKKDTEQELRRHSFPGVNLKYVIQKKPTGTGDAVLAAEKLIKNQFFVFNAERVDCQSYIKSILDKAKRNKGAGILLAGPTKTPWLFGILKVKGDKVLDLVEKPKRGKEASNLKIVGTYFLPREFLSYLKKVPSRPYSFEKALLLFAREKDLRIVDFKKETLALKFPWNLFEIRKLLMNSFLEARIEKSVKIGRGAIIEGRVYIGKNTKILEGAIVKGPCYIGENCFVGNNALIRDYTILEKDVLIGANAEVARSIFQDKTSCHSGFFGDSIFAKNCWLGAGVITANKRFDKKEVKAVVKGQKIDTGLTALGAIIGENTKIGVNISLMPGVLIGANSIVGPHSLITKNIGDNQVFSGDLRASGPLLTKKI